MLRQMFHLIITLQSHEFALANWTYYIDINPFGRLHHFLWSKYCKFWGFFCFVVFYVPLK